MAPDAIAELEPERLRRLIDVGRSLVSELRIEQVLDRLLDVARELTGAEYAALGILDDERRELARFITRGIDPDTHRAIGDLPRGRGILGVLIGDPRPLRLRDVTGDPRSYGFPIGHPPMGSFLGVPGPRPAANAARSPRRCIVASTIARPSCRARTRARCPRAP